MPPTPELVRALRGALVWLLALICLVVAPAGEGRELAGAAASCEAWCPCADEGLEHDESADDCDHADEHADDGDDCDDCDERCDDACAGCCGARLAANIASDIAIPDTGVLAANSSGAAASQARGRGLVTGVFRPPPSST